MHTYCRNTTQSKYQNKILYYIILPPRKKHFFQQYQQILIYTINHNNQKQHSSVWIYQNLIKQISYFKHLDCFLFLLYYKQSLNKYPATILMHIIINGWTNETN